MILITGGAGYIGSHINKLLNQKGYETLVLDNLSKGHKDSVKWGEFVDCDLGDEESLNDIFNTYDIEGVMHFAAFSSVAESMEEPEKYFKNNFENTLTLLKVMKEHRVYKIIAMQDGGTVTNAIRMVKHFESSYPNLKFKGTKDESGEFVWVSKMSKGKAERKLSVRFNGKCCKVSLLDQTGRRMAKDEKEGRCTRCRGKGQITVTAECNLCQGTLHRLCEDCGGSKRKTGTHFPASGPAGQASAGCRHGLPRQWSR